MTSLLPEDDRLRRMVLALLLMVPMAFGVLVGVFDQDANWDLLNYHWYDAYAALNGRMDRDMGAAQTPTYYNPTLDIPFFVAAGALPARVFGFLLGVLQGCNFILLYMLAWRVLRFEDERLRVLACAIVAFAGMIGGGHLGLVGALFYDNIVSLFVFAGMIVALGAVRRLPDAPYRSVLMRGALAGVLVGMAVGLKLPTQIFAVGICFGLLFVPGDFIKRFFLSFACGLGVLAGFAVFGGWWMWELAERFGNPLFPYFNDVIRSPWALPESYRDDRFMPEGLGAALLLPFRLFIDGRVAGEIPFRDARILAAFIALLATPVMLLIARVKPAAAPFAHVYAARYLAAVAGLSYAVWLGLFCIYRYLVPLEMLAPLLIVVAVGFWPIGQRRISLALGMIGFVVVTAQPGTWGRVPWASGLGGKFVDVTVPPVADPANTIVLMTGFAPTAFVIPAFPGDVTFLRPHSYLVEPQHPTRFNDVMHARIAAHRGDFYLLRAEWEDWASDKVLPHFGLRSGECRPITANLDRELELCAVERLSSPAD